jgi:predicted DNA-binding ribbon-helix-helix protein
LASYSGISSSRTLWRLTRKNLKICSAIEQYSDEFWQANARDSEELSKKLQVNQDQYEKCASKAKLQWESERPADSVLAVAVLVRSIILAGHKTSVSLEDAFWEGLKDIAKTKRKTLSELVGGIDIDREHANPSSAIRLFVLNHYQARRDERVELAAS